MRIVVALVCLVAGCVRANLVECGEKLCSPSQSCIADRCIDPDLVCTSPGSECDALGAPGRCLDGVCEVATCGDGFVDTALREDCDDSIPELHCADAGFDLGRPGCTACQIDLREGCISFGWRLAVNAPAEKLWTDGDTFAYWRLETSTFEVHGPGVDLVMPVGDVYDIQGGGGRIVVRSSAGSFDILGGVMEPLSLPGKVLPRVVKSFDVASDGTLVILDSDCTTYSHPIGGVWTKTAKVPVTGCSQIEVSGGRTFVVTSANEIWMLATDGYVRRFSVDSTVHQIVYGMASGLEGLWIASDRGLLFARDNSVAPNKLFDEDRITSVALADGAVYGQIADANTVVRWAGASIGRLRSPSNLAITSNGTTLFAYRGPIYRYSGIDFSSRAALPALALQEVPVGTLDGSVLKVPLVVTSYGLYAPGPSGESWTLVQGSPLQPNAVRAVGGVPDFVVYSAYLSAPELDRRPTLGVESPEVSVQLVPVPTDPFIHALWVAPDRTIVAVGDDDAGRGFLGIRTPDEAWSTFVPPGACAIRGVHARELDAIYAVGACDQAAVVWRYDGASWTEIARFAELASLAAVRVLGENRVAAVGQTGMAWLDGTTWTIDPTVVGTVLSGTLDDLWVSGSFTNVQRFDGTSWSQMTTSALMPIQVMAEERRVLLPGAAAGFVELLR